MRRIRFDPNAEDGDGDGRVQDNTPFERPSVASGGIQQRLGEIVRSTPEDKVKDYSSFMTEAELRDAAERRGVNPDVYFDPALDEQDVEDATSKWSLGKTGRQNATDAVIVRQGDNGPEVLMIERKFGPFRGSAALPGGLVDRGESFEDAADREMMEEVQVDASQALERTPLGYVKDSYTWDPRFVDGANLGAVRYDVAPDVEVQAEDDALAASWVPLSEIASGQRSVAFGHAAWLAEAFKDDERFGEQLAVVARLSEQRNQRVIKKVNGVRQGMAEPMIPERRGSWKPTTDPPTPDVTPERVEWEKVDDIVDYSVAPVGADVDPEEAKMLFMEQLYDDWEQWKECRAIRQEAYRLAGQDQTDVDPSLTRTERNLFGDPASEEAFETPVDTLPINDQAKHLMGSLVKDARDRNLSSAPVYRAVKLDESTRDAFFAPLVEGAEIDIPLLSAATRDVGGDTPLLSKYGDDAIIEFRGPRPQHEMRGLGAYGTEADEANILMRLEEIADEVIDEGDEDGFGEQLTSLISEYNAAKAERSFELMSQLREEIRQIKNDFGIDGIMAGEEIDVEQWIDNPDLFEDALVNEVVLGGRFLVESVEPDPLYGTRIIMRNIGVFDPMNPGELETWE